ncbi:hypothetical protein ACFW08_38410, partial [Streptomyces sp. NPDC058960]|uniref:hypothetical protein n=1 Tax=Streptomyces sp. NPDC058960 TaxID=3346679 RepID=UPI0036CFFE70
TLTQASHACETAVFDRAVETSQPAARGMGATGADPSSRAPVAHEDALLELSLSPYRHVAEPALAYLSGHVRDARWRFSRKSAAIPTRDGDGQGDRVVVPGHFSAEGRHTELWGTPARYLLDPVSLRRAAARMSDLLAPYAPEVLLTPAVGGVPLATATAMYMRLPLAVAEKAPGAGLFAGVRGAQPSGRTALVDSTYHSGRTLSVVADMVAALGGNLVAAAVAIRSIVPGGLPAGRPSSTPVHALHNIVVHAWHPRHCPDCLRAAPVDPRPARYERSPHGPAHR